MERITSRDFCTYSTEATKKSKNKKQQRADLALSEASPKHKPWDTHRAQAQDVMGIYEGAERFERYAQRISQCSGLLQFQRAVDENTGEIGLQLKHAYFCRVRTCPVCQWRRSLMWQARFLKALPKLSEVYPTARWIFVTLTVPNCPVDELRETLRGMNEAWHRLIKRKELKPVLGFVRTTEVTPERKREGYAHPHFHALLMVPSNWFGKNYVSHKKWLELWRSCMKDDTITNVNVKAVKNLDPEDPRSGIQRAVAETLKYSTKPDDMIDNPEWFLEMTRQVKNLRFMATGGVLKNFLAEPETDEELTEAEEKDEPVSNKTIAFDYRPTERRYRQKHKV